MNEDTWGLSFVNITVLTDTVSSFPLLEPLAVRKAHDCDHVTGQRAVFVRCVSFQIRKQGARSPCAFFSVACWSWYPLFLPNNIQWLQLVARNWPSWEYFWWCLAIIMFTMMIIKPNEVKPNLCVRPYLFNSNFLEVKFWYKRVWKI